MKQKVLEVELNFPEGKEVIEESLSIVLAKIISNRCKTEKEKEAIIKILEETK